MQSQLPSLRLGKLVLIRPFIRDTGVRNLVSPFSISNGCSKLGTLSGRSLGFRRRRLLDGHGEPSKPAQKSQTLTKHRGVANASCLPFRSEEGEGGAREGIRAVPGRSKPRTTSGVHESPEIQDQQRRTQNITRSPPKLLAEYLDQHDVEERRSFAREMAREMARYLNPHRLPTILLAHMHMSSFSERMSHEPEDRLIKYQLDRSATYLKSKGVTAARLNYWSWILSGKTADDKVERFFSQTAQIPHFVLMEILRNDIYHIRSLQQVLSYLLSSQEQQPPLQQDPNRSNDLISSDQLEDNFFGVLISRLLYHARRVWPAAVISVSHLVSQRIQAMTKSQPVDALPPRLKRRITSLLNHVIVIMSIPASISPLTSSRHIWDAQKEMLQVAGGFSPPLLLSQKSYQSVVATLMASKKTESEVKSVVLRTRSWPPWRRDQDGMDAKRSAEDDFSRVLSATSKMQEAGFRLNASDEAARIYGGMELDGTPTIQTRRILRRSLSSSALSEMSCEAWKGRIEATRDAQEAWGAFLEFKRRGGVPSQTMFFAMFEKINYHEASLGRRQEGPTIPGNGKEVMPTSNDNFTKYYIERHQPPPLSILYAEMLHRGIRPTGKCLAFLVSKARSSDEGIGYLLDSGIDRAVLERLSDPDLHQGHEDFKQIPDKILCAYVELICRLAPRRVDSMPNSPGVHLKKISNGNATVEDKDSIKGVLSENTPIRPGQSSRGKFVNPRETFSHVGYLLKSSSTKYRPTWYAYLRALAREGAIIPGRVVGSRTSNWNSVTWNRLAGVLKGFHAIGLELDPQGFHYLCMGFEKFATEPDIENLPLRQLGPDRHKSQSEFVSDAIEIVKDEFRKLSSSQDASSNLPTLFHSIRGVHLHAYIRALGVVKDYDAIVDTVDWMTDHNEELEAIAQETRNGYSSFGKTLVAICHFLDGTDYAARVQQQIETVGWWGEWPSSEEVAAYLRFGREDAEMDEVASLIRADVDRPKSNSWIE